VTPLALTVLVASILGSLHCAAMCGGLVAFYVGDPASRRARDAAVSHLCYNAGRLLAYTLIGALAGAIGAAFDQFGALVGIQRVVGAVAGALIVLWGSASLLGTLGWRVPRLEAPPALAGLIRRGVASLGGHDPRTRALVIGLLTGCLPCGWLYAFVVTAAGTGTAAAGAATMAVFWLGTLPAMAGLGLGLRALAGPFLRHVPAACAVAMILVGLFAVAGRMMDPHVHVAATASSHGAEGHGAH